MRVVLFTGKGGVGKTTLAAATAAWLAHSGATVLAVSTDPAHSLGDTFAAPLGTAPVELARGLHAAHVDTRTLLGGAWVRLQEHLRTVLAGSGVDELVADELTVLPGVEELLALAQVHRVAQDDRWDAVVVDCGPTAETLRLLALPEAVAGYLERLFPAHRRAVHGMLAGLAGTRDPAGAWDRVGDALGELVVGLGELRGLLTDPRRTAIRLVLTPERVVAAETRRTRTALALHGLPVDSLLVNQLVPAPPASLRGPTARWLSARHTEQQAVLAELAATSAGPGGPRLRTAPYLAAEPVGVAALRELAAVVYGTDDPLAPMVAPAAAPWQVRRTAGTGTSVDSAFELVLRLPGVEHDTLDLVRVGDDLAVTASGTRRMVALPAALRRCTVTAARLHGDDLCVAFVPDPAVWSR